MNGCSENILFGHSELFGLNMMSFLEICLEADKAKTNMNRLTELWEYVKVRKNSYTPSHFGYIKDHLNEYAKRIIKEDQANKVKNHFNDE